MKYSNGVEIRVGDLVSAKVSECIKEEVVNGAPRVEFKHHPIVGVVADVFEQSVTVMTLHLLRTPLGASSKRGEHADVMAYKPGEGEPCFFQMRPYAAAFQVTLIARPEPLT